MNKYERGVLSWRTAVLLPSAKMKCEADDSLSNNQLGESGKRRSSTSPDDKGKRVLFRVGSDPNVALKYQEKY